MDCLNTSSLIPLQESVPFEESLKRFQKLAAEDTSSVDSLREYSDLRRTLTASLLNTDSSSLGGKVLDARRHLVWGICAVANPEVDIEEFQGIHEEMCMTAFVDFLKNEGLSLGWSVASIEQLITCCEDFLTSAIELRSYAIKEVSEKEIQQSLVAGRFEETMETIGRCDDRGYVLLPGGWCGDENTTGHFFFVMVSKCQDVALLKLFDTQPCIERGAERIDSGGWRLKLYVEQEVDQPDLEELIRNILLVRTFQATHTSQGDKICKAIYYTKSNSQKTRSLQADDTIVIRGDRGCVADSLHAFLTYWERSERTRANEGKSLFTSFQRYLWARYQDDIDDPTVHQSISNAMRRAEKEQSRPCVLSQEMVREFR